jgi:hypothetical protein
MISNGWILNQVVMLVSRNEKSSKLKRGLKTMNNNINERADYEEFDGIVSLNLQVRLPASFYAAVKEYCSLTNTTIHEWFNESIILEIEAIELGPATSAFIERYHLRELTTEKRHVLMQFHRSFKLKEEKIGEED